MSIAFLTIAYFFSGLPTPTNATSFSTAPTSLVRLPLHVHPSQPNATSFSTAPTSFVRLPLHFHPQSTNQFHRTKVGRQKKGGGGGGDTSNKTPRGKVGGEKNCQKFCWWQFSCPRILFHENFLSNLHCPIFFPVATQPADGSATSTERGTDGGLLWRRELRSVHASYGSSATRGLTFLLDEYKTSKMCPCGHDELKTTGYRFRAHKSDGAGCPLVTRLGARSCDRDALASLNMVSCALCALAGRTRPEHLCRSKCMRCG